MYRVHFIKNITVGYNHQSVSCFRLFDCENEQEAWDLAERFLEKTFPNDPVKITHIDILEDENAF